MARKIVIEPKLSKVQEEDSPKLISIQSSID